MSIWRNVYMATQSAVSAFKFSIANPGTAVLSSLSDNRNHQYILGWNAYTNEVFDAMRGFDAYAASANIYPKTKGVYNPMTRLVDCYASHIYPGVLSTD